MEDSASKTDQKPNITILSQWKPITIALLTFVAALELAAYFFGTKATRLESEGLVTTAEIFEVSEDVLGTLLEPNNTNGTRSKARHRTVSYRFTTQDGVDVESSYKVLRMVDPLIGSPLEIRYLPTDPSVHERTVGHTVRQTSALHWIAAFFAALWICVTLCGIGSHLMPRKLTTREKRLKKMKELQSQ